MGWIPSISGSKPEEKAADKPYEPPMRSKRDKCYAARDAFFNCLEQNNILDAIKDQDKSKVVCGAQNQQFEQNCATAWVEYFKKRRVVEYQKVQTIRRIEAEGGEVHPPGPLPPK
ncbi:hypothetical protein BU16DRAFT_522687 [Lophium mytilinum]|uniref:Uncharacterized protein n=1 Tax=Lophium mytilinum TaxID=390894 RepID=A0A6A6RBR5_9PEZI|nr:hypothetical protein BU16DRAFT_522687 [Lophium mytilinum]